MKTVYTDKTGVMPWLWLGLGVAWFGLAAWSYDDVARTGSWDLLIIRLLVGVGFLGLAIRRFLQIRHAKAEGRDHTIVRVKNAPDR
mgnify:CR=1 FL=1|tara:strand:+ start:191 stop:448 length:258 start_codon:yes stop_codon:yes gene_type:complete